MVSHWLMHRPVERCKHKEAFRYDVDIWLQLSGGTGITPHAVQIQCHSFESQQLYTDSTSLCQCHMRISVAKRNLMLWHMPTKHQGTLAIKGPLVNGSNQ
ncbi:hypothetical protein BDL97_02G169700 [Sphagnum fallax]|nr:hypothetical protein BDL97_02G169700 [Sphagnum fallax]